MEWYRVEITEVPYIGAWSKRATKAKITLVMLIIINKVQIILPTQHIQRIIVH